MNDHKIGDYWVNPCTHELWILREDHWHYEGLFLEKIKSNNYQGRECSSQCIPLAKREQNEVEKNN